METVMNTRDLLLALPILIPVLGGLLVAFVKALDDMRLRRVAVTCTLAATALAVLAVILRADSSLTLFYLTPSIPVLLRIDNIGRLYSGFISLVFLCVGIYSFEYMHHEKNEKRFYAFYLFTLAALMGLSLCGTIVTLYMFYEAMTLLSLPLVTHTQTKEAVAAGIKYLIYSVIGASLALAGIFFLGSTNYRTKNTAGLVVIICTGIAPFFTDSLKFRTNTLQQKAAFCKLLMFNICHTRVTCAQQNKGTLTALVWSTVSSKRL